MVVKPNSLQLSLLCIFFSFNYQANENYRVLERQDRHLYIDGRGRPKRKPIQMGRVKRYRIPAT